LDASINIEAWFARQRMSQPPFSGQLDPGFQAALLTHFNKTTEADSVFYHTVELPDGRVISGDWDLRGHEDTYLGGSPFAGKRVIEYGPATGWISAHIAARARALTVFDLPIGAGPDPIPGLFNVPETFALSAAAHTDGQRNSWWFVRNTLGFQAHAVYADIFDPPGDLGRYDIAVFGCILLHLMHPYRALQGAAAITDEAIIVTDLALSPHGREVDPELLFAPSPPPNGVFHWWYLSSLAVCQMLVALGFPQLAVTTHRPVRMPDAPPLYTVIARRR
jgi:hypothetical protein